MDILTTLERKQIPYTVTMLTSLGINEKKHLDVYLLSSNLTKEDVDDIKEALGPYDMTIISVTKELLPETAKDAISLNADMIVNRPLEGNIDVLSARDAHNAGVTYEEAKEGVAIVEFTGAKPWENGDFHFDIERLWWDYARKTPFYLKILEGFINEAIEDRSVEEYLRGLIADVSSEAEAFRRISSEVAGCIKG